MVKPRQIAGLKYDRRSRGRNALAWWSLARNWAWDTARGLYIRLGGSVAQSDMLTFARNSVAYRNVSGVDWTQSAVDVLRSEPGGIRVEKASTNMALQSADMTNAIWRLLGTATREATAIASPIGNLFTRYFRNSEIANALIIDQNITTGVTVGEWYCAWFYVMGEGANIGKLAALEVKRFAGGSYAGTTIRVRLTAKPQLVWVYFQTITGNTAISPVLHVGNTDLFTAVLVSDLMVNPGKTPLSPSPSGASQVIRAADALTLKLPAACDLEITFADKPLPIMGQQVFYQEKLLQTFLNQNGDPWSIGLLHWGSKIVRFDLRPGDVCFEDTADKERCELMTGTRFAKGVDIWNSHAFRVNGSFQTSLGSQDWFYIGQWHGDTSDGRSPYFSIKIVGNDLIVDKRIYNGAGGQSAVENLYTWKDFPRDRWINVVMQHEVDATAGFGKVWIDGVLVVDTGLVPFGYWDHPNAGYWKWGIYRNAGNGGNSVVDYQNWEEGTADLSGRVTTPLALETGKQTILDATPVDGLYVLDAAALNYPVIEKILALN